MIKYLLPLAVGFLFLTTSSTAQQTVGLFTYDSAKAYEGYTLISPFYGKNTYLLNNCGHAVHSWTSQYTPGAMAYVKPNGNLIRAAHITHPEFDMGGGNGGRIEEFDWEGNLIWYVDLSSDSFSQHHDFELLPNGNILVLMWEFVPRSEAIAAGRQMNEMQPGIWAEAIWELKPKSGSGADVVWKWNVMDHLVQDYDETKPNYGFIPEHPELINFNYQLMSGQTDWLHFNSIDYNPELDQIMVSCYSFNEIYIIDHSTSTQESSGHTGGTQNRGGDILYRYGNPMAYQRGTQSDQVCFRQHDAQWIPKGYPRAGKVVFFNNGGSRNYSSVDLFTPPVNQDGSYPISPTEPFTPVKSEWSYTAPVKTDFYSVNISGVDPLANGHFLICEGTKGHLFEVDYNKKTHWKYVNPMTGFGPVRQGVNPFGNSVFRSLKYSSDYDAFTDKVITDGPPLEINPLPILCDDTSSIGGGDTTINDTTTESVQEQLSVAARIFPNPFTSHLSISGWTGNHLVTVTDALGQVVYTSTFENREFEVPLHHLGTGIYTLQITDRDRIQVYRQKLMKL